MIPWLLGKQFLHLGTEGHRPLPGNLVAGFDPRSVARQMTKEAPIDANCHAWFQDILAMRAEEGCLGLMKANGVRKGAHQVVEQAVLLKANPSRVALQSTSLYCLTNSFGKTDHFWLALSIERIWGSGVLCFEPKTAVERD